MGKIHLSQVSKFQAFSWGIPSSMCINGQKYIREGTLKKIPYVCMVCYTRQGRIHFSENQKILYHNWEVYAKDSQAWVNQISLQIAFETNSLYFRWFHSGDLQNEKMLLDLFTVAKKCPSTYFWLPTQEYQMVLNVCKKEKVPENVCIRISSPIIDQLPSKYSIKGVKTSMVCYREPVNCIAHLQEGKCGCCRKCWERDVEMVSYPLKSGGQYWPKSTAQRMDL